MPTLSDWESIDRQKARIRDERDAAMAKILRLSKQEKLLEEKEKRLIRSGLNSMQELEEQEEKEAKEAEEKREQEEREAAVEKLLDQPTPPADPGFDPFVFDPSLD
ncbi:hypothetical protein HYALB_00013406, partial [Hymenoscyphus albidus]